MRKITIPLFIFFTLIGQSVRASDLDRVVVKGAIGAKLDDYMSRLERLGYSGALLVAKDGVVVLHKAYDCRVRE